MAGSFRKIDYTLRPAKHAERRMLCDIFRRLDSFNPLSKYVYVGFGAIAFADFILFHKALGIRDMVSIEQIKAAIPRVEANKPFNTIEIKSGPASAVLPKLSWATPHIIWLDYDESLSVDMLLDITTVANHALSGTALSITFQCEKAKEAAQATGDQKAVDLFVAAFGRDRVPGNIDELDLLEWAFAALGRKIIVQEIQTALAVRNSSLPKNEHIDFKEVCSIEYNDGAKMFTISGVFVAHKDQLIWKSCEYGNLDFIPKPRRPIRIEIPKLTLREIRDLERQLPLESGATLQCGLVPAKDAQAFEKHYRYLPNFAVLEN